DSTECAVAERAGSAADSCFPGGIGRPWMALSQSPRSYRMILQVSRAAGHHCIAGPRCDYEEALGGLYCALPACCMPRTASSDVRSTVVWALAMTPAARPCITAATAASLLGSSAKDI